MDFHGIEICISEFIKSIKNNQLKLPINDSVLFLDLIILMVHLDIIDENLESANFDICNRIETYDSVFNVNTYQKYINLQITKKSSLDYIIYFNLCIVYCELIKLELCNKYIHDSINNNVNTINYQSKIDSRTKTLETIKKYSLLIQTDYSDHKANYHLTELLNNHSIVL